MANDFRQYDEHGFPLPPRFSDLKFHDDEQPNRAKISLRTKRLVMLAVLVGLIIPVVFGPQILSAGRGLYSQWLTSRAEQSYLSGDIASAMADLSRAISWNPGDWKLFYLRAQMRENINNLLGSLADWTELLRLVDSNDALAEIYTRRSWVYVRLGRLRQAIDDANQAVRLFPMPETLNTRAYARALANMELEEGLTDVQKALSETSGNAAEYLDTRGYLLHLMDRNAEALADLEKAVEQTEQAKRAFLMRRSPTGARNLAAQIKAKEIDHALAVMYHHRGLVYDKLGRKEEAQHDIDHGDELGYDPAKGVL